MDRTFKLRHAGPFDDHRHLALNHWKADAAGMTGGVVNALGSLLIIPWLSQKDIGNELLWVSIVEREPRGLGSGPSGGEAAVGPRKADRLGLRRREVPETTIDSRVSTIIARLGVECLPWRSKRSNGSGSFREHLTETVALVMWPAAKET